MASCRDIISLSYDSSTNSSCESISTSGSETSSDDNLWYSVGIEIELVVRPHAVFKEGSSHFLDPKPNENYWRRKLVEALKSRGLDAAVGSSHVSAPEHYDKWYVTRDGSLQTIKYEGI